MLIQHNKYLQWAPEVSGDSALLLPLLYYPQNITKVHDLCVVLHFIDDHMRTSISDNVTLVSFHNTAEDFVDQILTCKNVMSSSLHGLILSHSYGIPARGIKVSDKVEGGDFKFEDYYRSLGIYMKNYRVEGIDLQKLHENVKHCLDLIKYTPQPAKEKIKELQAKLLRTFPWRAVATPKASELRFQMF